MKVELVRGRDFTRELAERWVAIQRSNALYRDPLLRPEFTLAVSGVRQDVEIGLMREGGEIVGFFPFQRSRWNVGRPVGSRLSELHSAIVAPGFSWQAADLVRSCRLAAWHFHQLPAAQTEFAAHGWRFDQALYLDLSGGFEAYAAGRRKAGSKKLKQAGKLARRAERQFGPLRFVHDTRDPAVFASLLEWKSAYYRRTRTVNVLTFDWVVALLERILSHSRVEFTGMLSALYFGDRLAAVELGLRSHDVLHGWFASYNPAFSSFSPGTLLQVELAKAAERLEIRRIELGKNNMPYKASFASAGYPVVKGSVAVHPWMRVIRGCDVAARRLASMRPLQGPRQYAGKLVRPLRDWLAMGSP